MTTPIHAPSALFAFGWLPERASTMAPQVDHVFIALLLASVAMVVVLLVLNLAFLIHYRRGSKADRRPMKIAPWKIETGWITATTLGFLAFFYCGARLYVVEERPPAASYQIDVVGRQWMWDIRQPNGRREFDTLHVPSEQNIQLLLTSEDVIHSFFVPAFRLKQDVVPGRRVSLWFNATKEGTFPIFCTQYCGTKHSAMIGQLVVMSPSAYAEWLTHGPRPGEILLHGRELFVKYSCSGCHDQPSQIHAPPLQHVFGSLVPVQNGRFVRADEAYIRDSILEPTKDVVAGYAPIMPSFKGVVPESDLLELINYLKALSQESAPNLSSP